VRRDKHKSDGSKEKSLSKTRRVLFWVVYVLVFTLVVVFLLFPYDKFVEGLVVRAAARNGFEFEFESFDYRFPARIVCRRMTVTPKVGGRGGSIHWREFECRIAARPLVDRRIDVMHLQAALESGDETEGEYRIEASFVVAMADTPSGMSASGQVVHIRSLTLEGQGVNLSISGDVTISGSPRSRGIDLSVDIEKLDRVSSANEQLSMLFMGLKFAMGDDEPPLGITMRGQGMNLDIEKRAVSGVQDEEPP